MQLFNIDDSSNITIRNIHIADNNVELGKITNSNAVLIENVQTGTKNRSEEILRQFIQSVDSTSLDQQSKKDLIRESLEVLLVDGDNKPDLIKEHAEKLGFEAGNAVKEFFMQVAANVTSAVILSIIATE